MAVKIEQNDFLYNAGIIGLLYLLKDVIEAERGADYEIEANSVSVNKEILCRSSLADDYVNAFIQKFGDDSPFSLMIERVEKLQDMTKKYLQSNAKEDKKAVDEEYKYLLNNTGLLRASYLSGEQILKAKGYVLDLKSRCKEIKSIKDYAEKCDELLNLARELKQDECRRVFLFKDIIYSRINAIWSNKAFLNRANAKKDMVKIYDDEFIAPMQEYLTKGVKEKKTSKHCILCDSILPSSTANISFLNDSIDDMNRKKSYFWDNKPDAFICPVCAFIYSLAPLGFTAMGRDMVFVNANMGIKELEMINRGIGAKLDITEIEDKNKTLYSLWNRIVLSIIESKEYEESNIQVIVREKDTDKYSLNIIAKDIVGVLKESKNYLKAISSIRVKLRNGSYVNVFNEVLKNILNRNDQYALINKLFRESLDENRYTDYLKFILNIQLICNKGADNNMSDNNFGKARVMYYAGQEWRNFIKSDRGGNEDTDNKLRSLVFQLLNALQVRDMERYMQVVFKTYTGSNMPIPSIFLQAFAGDDEFEYLGYAYVLGLKAVNEKKAEKELENISK